MKKTVLIFTICILFAALTACKGGRTQPDGSTDTTTAAADSAPDTQGADDETAAAEPGVSDYFPMPEDTRYVYEGEGNEYASYTVEIDFAADGRVQQRVDNGGTVSARVFAVDGGKLVQTFSSGEVYYRENLLDRAGQQEVLLSEPIAEGTSWKLADGSTRTITGVSVPVSTPAGDYEAVEVTTQGAGEPTVSYYARDVGLVKTVYGSGETQVSSTLSSIERDVPLTQTVRFFYPDGEQEAVYYADRDVQFRTNDETAAVLADAYRDAPEGAESPFSDATRIRSLSARDDGAVALDLNGAFVSDQNAGSGYEQILLQAVADTFAYYYAADRVVLTVEGKPYSSGHFEFQEGEALTADFSSPAPLPG